MSAPSHDPVASTSAIRPTRRPAAALATPHTWATSASRAMAVTSRSVAVLIPPWYRTDVRLRKEISHLFKCFHCRPISEPLITSQRL